MQLFNVIAMPLRDDSPEKWEYKEHTKIKHEILGKYLIAWTKVLGGVFNNIHVFDCFAGRGRYSKDEEGSPLIIINSIAEVRKMTGKPPIASCIFIEKNANNYANLKNEISELCLKHSDWLYVGLYNDEFADVARIIVEEYGNATIPSFFFIDPFGFGGVPFTTISDILSFQKSEVFITFMIRDVKRFLESDSHKHSIEELYGICNVAKEIVEKYSDLSQEHALLKLYRDRLHSVGNVKYTFPFKMDADERLQTTYYLIHCTNSPLGCEIMKNIMYKSGTEGRFGYFGPAEGQMILSQFEGVQKLKEFLSSRFTGNTISYQKIRHKTLMDTDFSQKSYREAILELEKAGKVTIKGKGPKGGLRDTSIIIFN